MKSVNNNIKNSLKNATTQRKGRILVNENYYDVYNVEYYANIYEDGKVIGNAIASQLDFDIPYMPKFDTFKYYDGVWTGSQYEYVDMGTFIVFDDKDEDEFTKHITAFDKLINFNKPFEERGTYPKSLYDELTNICQQAEVQLENLSIPNGSFTVVSNQFTNGESLKTVLKQLCAVSGTYGIISNDKLKLQLINDTNEIIDNTQHEPMNWKRRTYGINQVIIGDATVEGEYVIKQDDADIQQNGVHKLEILGNLFAPTQSARESLINGLFNQAKGFGYIPYELKGEWLNYLEIGDKVKIDGIDTIVLRILGESPQALNSEMSAPALIDSSVEYVDNTETINNRLQKAERTVDKQNLIIEDVVELTDEQNDKISQITQTVDEINSKISDIADITISGESNFATFTLDNINESEPIMIKVRPITDNISYLYPNINLYPSSNLFLKVRTVRFTNRSEYEQTQDTKYTNYRNYYSYNETTYTLLVKGTDYQVGDTISGTIYQNKEIDYELPDDLLFYDSEHYDEFYLDYDSHTCQITKRCKYNTDGTVGLLSSEQIVPYEYPSIVLNDGNYTLQLLGYEYGYLFVRLMAKNIYTTQFYTKAEVDSHINQATQEINIGVNAKFQNYSTTTEMNAAIQLKANEINSVVATKVGDDEIISKINQSAEQITIDADKISLEGKTINMTADDVNITSENLTIDDTGKIELKDEGNLDANFIATSNEGESYQRQTKVNSYGLWNYVGESGISSDNHMSISSMFGYPLMQFYDNRDYTTYSSEMSAKMITLLKQTGTDQTITMITADGITTPSVTQTSKKEYKKNFEKLENALDVIKNIDIYKYNLVGQNDTDKKHIGFIIGDKYKYSKEVTSQNDDGVDIYSFVSVCCKAIQEQQEMIEKMQKEIKSLKERNDE